MELQQTEVLTSLLLLSAGRNTVRLCVHAAVTTLHDVVPTVIIVVIAVRALVTAAVRVRFGDSCCVRFCDSL